MAIIQQDEVGVLVSELRHEHDMSSDTLRKRSKYGEMGVAMLSEMKVLAEGNRRLERMYADNLMQNELRKEALEKIGKALIAQCEVL